MHGVGKVEENLLTLLRSSGIKYLSFDVDAVALVNLQFDIAAPLPAAHPPLMKRPSTHEIKKREHGH